MSECPPGVMSLDDLPVLDSATQPVHLFADGSWEYLIPPDLFSLDCNERISLDLHQCEAVICLPDEGGAPWRAFYLNGKLYVVHTPGLQDEAMPFDIAQEDRPWVVSLRVIAESGIDVLGKQAH